MESQESQQSTRTLSLQQEDEILTLVYAKWYNAYANLKTVKAEKSDGSEDWHLFHKARLVAAIETEARYAELLAALQTIWPDVILR